MKLLDSAPELRPDLIEALGRFGDRRATPALLKQLDGDGETQCEVLTALKRLKDPASAEAVFPLLTHRDPLIRRRTVDVLGRIGDAVAAERIEKLVKSDHDAEVRAAAAKALGEIADPASVDVLLEAVEDEYTVRCRAIRALGRIGDEAALPALFAKLKDGVSEVRFHAAVALGEVGHDNAVVPLTELLADPNPMVKRGATKSLEKLGVDATRVKVGRRKKVGETKSRVAWSDRLAPSAVLHLLFPATAKGRAIMGGAVGTIAIAVLAFAFISIGGEPPRGIVIRANVQDVAFSPEGKLLAVARDRGVLEVWKVRSQSSLRESNLGASGVDWTADGRLAVTIGPRLQIEAADGKAPLVMEGHKTTIKHFVISSSRTIAATCDRKGVAYVWDLAAGENIGGLTFNVPESISALAVSSDGTKLALGRTTGSIEVWSLAEVKMLIELQTLGDRVTAAAWSPDGSRIAAGGGNGVIRLFDPARKAAVVEVASEGLYVKRLMFQPATGRLVTLRNGAVEFWDAAGKLTGSWKPDGVNIDAASFAPDGKTVAVGNGDEKTVWLLDAETGKVQATLDVD